MASLRLHPMPHQSARNLVACVSVAVLGVALLAGCDDDADDVQESTADPVAAENAAPESIDTSDEQEPPVETAEHDEPAEPTAPEEESATPLDHAAALAAGLSGDTAIQCLYTYDAEELQGLRIAAQGGWVSPTADVYVYGDTIYWEDPQEYDATAHILGLDGDVYTWGTPGTGAGVAARSEAHVLEELPTRLENNASDCAVYTGPQSIFEVPGDVSFQWVG